VLPRKKGAHFLVVSELTNRKVINWAIFSIKFLIERARHHGIIIFWDFGRIMAIEAMEHRGSKL
jgi:hypothetical protein